MSLGRRSKRHRAAVARFNPQQHWSAPVLEPQLSSERLQVPSGRLCRCTAVRHWLQRAAATGTLAGTGSICTAASSGAAVPCCRGAAGSLVLLSSCRHVSLCLPSECLLLRRMLASGCPWARSHAPALLPVQAESPGNTPCCWETKSTLRPQAVTLVRCLLWLSDERRGQWWGARSRNVARRTTEITLSLWQQIHSSAASGGLENWEMRWGPGLNTEMVPELLQGLGASVSLAAVSGSALLVSLPTTFGNF